MREAFAINCERPVFFLVVDVEVEDIGGNLVFAEAVGDFADAGFRIVAVAALLVAQCEQRRQRHAPGECGVVAEHTLGIRAIEEVVVERTVFGAEGVSIALGFAEVETAAVSVVEENSVGVAVVECEEEWDCLVERVARFLPTKIVSVPEGESFVAAVERASLVSKRIVVLVGGHGLPDAKRGSVEGWRGGGVVLGDE